MASEAERKKAAKEIAAIQKKDWEDWVAAQEEAGYTIVPRDPDRPLGFDNAMVAEVPEGPTYNITTDGGTVEET